MSEHRGTDGTPDLPSAAEVQAIRADLEGARRALANSEREAAEREAMLLGEVQHRVRGVVAMIRSVFARTVETGESLDEVSRHFRGRLDVIARHQFPHPTVNDLERLVRDEFRDFRFGYEGGIAIGGPEVDLLPAQVLPVALAIHELVTNALKFGALAQHGARLSLDWTVDAQAVTLRWAETGVGVVAPAPHRHGFGREFLEEALPFQIGATTEFALRPGGVLCTIRLPRAA